MNIQSSNPKAKNIDSPLFKAALFSISATTVLGSTIIAPSLPALESHFSDAKNIELLSKLILTLPALFIMIFSPISGFMLEKFGRLKLIYPAIIIWSLAGVSGFFLDNLYLLLASRAVFGTATAFLMTGVGVLLGDYYTGVKREKVLSMQGFFMAFGGTIFLILGGYLSNLDWRYPFLAYLLGFLILFLALAMLFEPKHHLDTTNHIQKSKKANIIKFIPVYLLAFFSMAMFYVAPTQLPFFITHTLGMESSYVGVSMAVASISMAIFSLFYNRLRNYLNIFKIYFIGLFLIAISFTIIAVFHNYIAVLITFILMGAGLGFIIVNNSSWLFMLAKDFERAKAYGFLTAFLFTGQFISPLISQPIVNAFGMIGMFYIFGGMLYIVALIFLFTKMKQNNPN
ncbi:MFS transporter [Helicobacter sp. 13S00477-4]|uniref:MFS transporter n=1 Tax=Helicobacter sp. 13S00477-4 TaxID=1905759 RepID=UPI000BA681CA|nr:MFS transporter [Helicobacter sp. 13S00477-4]PAF50583.1 MFS transporter [Helicobacter sp. 13S00477-4]